MNDEKKEKKPRKFKFTKKKIIIFVIVLLVVILAIVNKIKSASQTTVSETLPTIEQVELQDLSDTISVKGTVAGESKVNVTSKAMAEVTSLNVQVGDEVKEGDVLLTIDSTSIEEDIAKLEKTISNTDKSSELTKEKSADTYNESLADLEESLSEAQGALQFYQGKSDEYYEQQGTTKFNAVYEAQQKVTDLQKQIDRLKESRELELESEALENTDTTTSDNLKSLKEQLDGCTVTAPCNGVVTAVNIAVGDTAGGEKVTLLTIENTDSLKVTASVEEADILKVEEGMSAVVTCDAAGGEEIKGTVTRVVRVKSTGSVSDTSSSSSSGYSIEVTIDNSNLLVGMTAKAKIMIQENKDVLAVPYDLIQYDDNGNAFVMTATDVDYNNSTAKAVKTSIEVGEAHDYYTEITGGDLKEGDYLLYDYTYSITEGQTFTFDSTYMGTADSTDSATDDETGLTITVGE